MTVHGQVRQRGRRSETAGLIEAWRLDLLDDLSALQMAERTVELLDGLFPGSGSLILLSGRYADGGSPLRGSHLPDTNPALARALQAQAHLFPASLQACRGLAWRNSALRAALTAIIPSEWDPALLAPLLLPDAEPGLIACHLPPGQSLPRARTALGEAAASLTVALRRQRTRAERRQDGQAWRESEARYRLIADFTHDWETWLGPDGRLLYSSPSCERITGYPPQAFLADPDLWLQLVHPDDRARVREHFQTAGEGRDPNPTEYRLIRKDGEERWLDHICQPLYDGEGRFLGRRGGNHDITERKQVEDLLRRQQSLQEALLTALSDLGEGLVIEEGHQLLFANEAFCRLTGYSLAELAALESPLALVPPEARNTLVELVQEQRQREARPGGETTLIHRSGRRLEVEVAAASVPMHERGWRILIIRDISARKQMEERVFKSQASLAQAQRIARVGSWDLDLATGEILWSEEAHRILGLRPTSLEPGHGLLSSLETVHADDRSRVSAARLAVGQRHEPFAIEYRVSRSEGDDIVVREHAELVVDESGRAVRAIGTIQDVTEQVELDRVKDMFLGLMAHDVRGPLAVVRGYAELLARHLRAQGADERVMGWLHVINVQTGRVARLADDLVDSTALRLGQVQLEPIAADLVQLTEEVAAQVQATTDQHHLAVQATGRVLGRWDTGRLSQVLHNLIANAVKYSPAGKTVEISVGAREDRAWLIVRDRGIGIPPEAMDRLFDPFYRATNVQPGAGKGVGLGLFIARRLVEAHGGEIRIDSQLEQGTTVTVELPLFCS